MVRSTPLLDDKMFDYHDSDQQQKDTEQRKLDKPLLVPSIHKSYDQEDREEGADAIKYPVPRRRFFWSGFAVLIAVGLIRSFHL